MNTLKKFFLKSEDGEYYSKSIVYLNWAILIGLLLIAAAVAFNRLGYNTRWHTVYEYRNKFIIGFRITVLISFFSLLLSLILGMFFALARHSRIILLNQISIFYVGLIRGTPFLVQIFMGFYVIGTALNITNRYIAGVLILSIFSGAYVTEIIRAGIESIENTQIDAAKALGFKKMQMYRYIIMPQVIRRILPPLAGQFISLVKDSSLLSIIAVNEFTKNYQEVDSITFAMIENLTVLAIGYLILTIPMSYLAKYLERKYNYES